MIRNHPDAIALGVILLMLAFGYGVRAAREERALNPSAVRAHMRASSDLLRAERERLRSETNRLRDDLRHSIHLRVL